MPHSLLHSASPSTSEAPVSKPLTPDAIRDILTRGAPDFSGERIVDHAFYDAELEGLHAQKTVFESCSFRRANLSHADFDRATARNGDFRGATLVSACFYQADLRGARFEGATLARAELIQCDLRGARFVGADMRGTTVDQCRLDGGELAGAEA